jgi:hypothetical protein
MEPFSPNNVIFILEITIAQNTKHINPFNKLKQQMVLYKTQRIIEGIKEQCKRYIKDILELWTKNEMRSVKMAFRL